MDKAESLTNQTCTCMGKGGLSTDDEERGEGRSQDHPEAARIGREKNLPTRGLVGTRSHGKGIQTPWREAGSLNHLDDKVHSDQ